MMAVFAGGLLMQSLERAYQLRSSFDTRSDVRCGDSRSCERQDLRAQFKAAEAAELSADLAVWQTVFGFLGTLFLGGTLLYTVRSTNAAVEAASQARRATERTLRPYICFERIDTSWVWDTTKAQDQKVVYAVRFIVGWKNVGQTPAERTDVRISFALIEGDDVSDQFDFPDLIQGNTRGGALGPNQSFGTLIDVPLDIVYQAQTLKRPLLIWAWIEYDDYPGAPRFRTEFATLAWVYGDPATKEYSVNYRNVSGFNAHDEYCFRSPGATAPYRTFAVVQSADEGLVAGGGIEPPTCGL